MTLPAPKIYLVLCLAFIAGVFLGKYLSLVYMAIMAMFFVGIGSIGWQNKTARLMGFAGLVLLVGCLRINLDLQKNDLQIYYNKTAQISGVIVEEPDARSDKMYLTLGKLQIAGKNSAGKILITVARFPEYQYGQRLEFNSKITEPKDAQNKGEFSYKNYLSRYGISGLAYYPHIQVKNSSQGSWVKTGVLKIKQKFVERIGLLLPEPQNSFLAGLMVGLRHSIPDNLLQAFNNTGTTHIIAISGFNITIIAVFLDRLLQRFGRRVSFGLSLLAIVLFVILVGASASVVRAGIMGILGLVALNFGRLYVITNALATTAVAMIAFNPKILHFDVGFQLSFLSLFGLVYLVPILEPYFEKVPATLKLYLLPTIAAQIFTLPVLLYNFDRLSLISLVANVLILPVIPLTMLFGFVLGLLSFIWLSLAQILSWFVWLLLTYEIKIAELLSGLPLAVVEIKNFHFMLVLIYYAILAAILIIYYYPQTQAFISKWKIKLKTS